MVDDIRPGSAPPPPPRRRMRTGWQILGIVLAVVMLLGGLAIAGLMILVVVGMNSYAGNK